VILQLSRRWSQALIVFAVSTLLGCGGVIGSADGSGDGTGGATNLGGSGAGGPGVGGAAPGVGGPGAAGGAANAAAGSGAGASAAGAGAGAGAAGSGAGAVNYGPDTPAPEVRMVRLTHPQWQNTVRDLLQLPASTELSDFRPDPVQGGFAFDNDATSLQVDEALFNGYQRAAGELAELVTSDSTTLAKIAPSGWDDPSRGAEAFVRAFGQRAHRRPLSDEQVDDYLALATMAPGLYPSLPEAEARVRFLIEMFLQSPYFLYRIEQSDQVVGDVIPLDDWELASRLSYALWSTMPDDELFAAAAAGELADESTRATHVRRVVDDAKAERAVADFHRQLLTVDRFESISPSSTFFPDAPSDLAELAITENEMFVRDVFMNDGGWRDMLTSPRTFVNDDLADIYGLSGSFDGNFTPVDLDPSERAGVFTQIGFLAKNASSADPDPIHRGVFLAERIACIHIAAPDVMTPPPPAVAGKTNRQVIEEQTEDPSTVCASCHANYINPFGFPFEHYDAVGGFRTTDDGAEIDATASPLLDDMPRPVDGALELVNAMADSPGVHSCYLHHWVEYLRGRHEADEDEPLAGRLGDASSQGTLSIRDLLFEVAMSPTFAARNVEEWESP
jgi:hypothetical protein